MVAASVAPPVIKRGERGTPDLRSEGFPTKQQREGAPRHCTNRRQQLKRNGFTAGYAGLDQDSEVSDLVRNLVEEDGDCGDETNAVPGKVAGAHSQTVSEVVEHVGSKIEEPGNFDLFTVITALCHLLSNLLLLFIFLLLLFSFPITVFGFLLLLLLFLRRFLLCFLCRFYVVRVAVTSLQDPHKLLHTEEGHDATEDPQADTHVVRSVPLLSPVRVAVAVAVAVMVAATLALRGHHGVRDEVKEGVAQQSAAGKGQQDLQQPLLLLALVQRDEEEDEKWSRGDEESRHHRIEPDRRLVGLGILFVVIPVSVKFLTELFSFLLCWLFLLSVAVSMTTVTVSMASTTVAVSMTTVAVSMTTVTMSMSSTSMFVWLLCYYMGMSMAGDSFNIVKVKAFFVQSQILITRGVRSFGPFEGRSLLIVVAVSVATDPDHES